MKWLGFFNILKSTTFLIKSRIELIFAWTWITAVSCLIAGRGFPPIKPTLMSIFGMFFISASTYLYNDIRDKEMDALNPTKKNKPIISDTVSREDAMKIIYLFGLFGLTITLFINTYSFIFSFIFLFIFSIYSYPKIRLKTKFLGKEFTIFSGWLLCGLVGSYAVVGSLHPTVLFATILFAIWSFSTFPIIADAGDLEEDRIHDVKNLSVILSWKRKVQLLIFGFLFVMVVTPLTYVPLGFNIALPIFTVALSLIFIRLIYPKIVGFEKREYNERMSEYPKIRKLGYIYFILLEIVFIMGSINLNLIF
jgi:4-hydroxybenzoate polyprenyltransferase